MNPSAKTFTLSEIQEDILEMAASTEVGPVVPREVVEEPTLSELLQLGLLQLVHRRVAITVLGRLYLTLGPAGRVGLIVDHLRDSGARLAA